MTQLIEFPTRETNILDLCNSHELISDVHNMDTIYSDHKLILIGLNHIWTRHNYCYEEKISNPLKNVNVYSTDYNAVNHIFSKIPWTQELSERSCEKCYEQIVETISKVILENSLTKKPSKNKKSTEKRQRKVLWRERCILQKKLKEKPKDQRLLSSDCN